MTMSILQVRQLRLRGTNLNKDTAGIPILAPDPTPILSRALQFYWPIDLGIKEESRKETRMNAVEQIAGGSVIGVDINSNK